MAEGAERPIIVRRRKVVAAEGHHGGAWKVAYADFVTAMMAFFLLMWLLNATTEKQRKGLADYFNPTIPVNRISGGGRDALNGDSVYAEDTLARNGTGATAGAAARTRGADPATAEDIALGKVEDMLLGRGGESMVSEKAMRHIVTRVTDEGLIVEVFALPGAPLFEPESDAPTPLMTEIATMLARVFARVRNEVAVDGHVPSFPVVRRRRPVWGLSLDRADRIRRLIGEHGLATARFVRVTGHGDRSPAVEDLLAPRNARMEIVLLRSDIPRERPRRD